MILNLFLIQFSFFQTQPNPMFLLINVPVRRLYWSNVCTSWTFVLVWRLYQSDVCKSDVCTVQPLERQTFVGSAFPLVRYMVCSQKEKIVSRKFRISFALKKYENFFEIRNAKILRRKIEFIKKMQNFCENSSKKTEYRQLRKKISTKIFSRN